MVMGIDKNEGVKCMITGLVLSDFENVENDSERQEEER